MEAGCHDEKPFSAMQRSAGNRALSLDFAGFPSFLTYVFRARSRARDQARVPPASLTGADSVLALDAAPAAVRFLPVSVAAVVIQ